MITIDTFYEASYLLVALVLSISTLCFQLFEGRTRKRQNIVFSLILGDMVLSAASSALIVFSMPLGLTDYVWRGIYDVSQYLYFLAHTMIGPLFYTYVLEVSGAFYQQRISRHALTMLPCVLMELMILTNPLTHWVYTADEYFNFTRNWGEYVLYAVSGFYFVLSAAYLFFYWYALNFRRRWALIYSFGLVLTGVLIQLFFQELRVELVFESLGFLGALLHVEKEDDRTDAVSNVYNRNALLLDISNYARMERPFLALCIRISDSDILQRITGSADNDALLQLVAVELRRIFPAYHIYRSSASSFMLIGTEMSTDQMNTIAGVILRRFEGSWEYHGAIVQLNAALLLASIPDEFHVDDVLLLADGDLPSGLNGKVLSGDALSFLRRNVEVEEALARGFTDHSFEVFYKPVYDWKTRSMYAADAVLCLRDRKIGTLWQEEFLTIATENGSLDSLGDLMMREVARFLGSGIPTELGLEQITVALPAVQCIQPTFLKLLEDRVVRYEVNPARINIALQEISLVQDHAAFVQTLQTLREMGFVLTMDRYGLGHSGSHSLNFFDYDAVAIDLSSITEAASISIRRSILLSNIRMIGALNRKIHVKGLQYEEQLQILEETDIDYVSGPLFSGAVSQNELIAILRATDMSRQEGAKARAQNEAKSNFLANMSHEIRTPINAILGMNEMILREASDPSIRGYANDIARAGTSLLSIINDILDFSKIESGSMEIIEAPYDLSSVIHDVMNMIRIKTEEKGLSLSLDVDENLPEHLSGDEMRLRQILVNLMNNAVKYTEKGGVTLRIHGGYAEGKNVLLTCDVIDTGIGIREEEQSKLFEKFQRLDMEQTRTIEGTGLGLPITANLLAMMGGSIEVQSMYGVGSTFTAKLTQRVTNWTPIGKIEDRYRTYSEAEKADREAFVAPDAKILVVDDTNVNLTVIRALLKRTELQIDTALSGAEGLVLISRNKYDVIFLDYRMPEMNGTEALQRLKSDTTHPNQHTPVIVLTANALTGAKEKFLKEGFDDYIAKPVDPQKMEALLIRYLPKEKVTLRNAPEGKEASS